MDQLVIQNELYAAIKLFEELEIDYALCGGLAVAVYGFPRFTKDLDFLVAERDVDKAKEAGKERLGYFIDNGRLPFPNSRFDIYRITKIVEKDVLPLDMLIVPPSDDILKSRKRIVADNLGFWIVSLEELISMKEEAGRAHDRIDLERLRELQRDRGHESGSGGTKDS